MSAYKILVLCLLVVLLVCVLLLVSKYSDQFLTKQVGEDIKLRRKTIMTQQTNPNLGKKFPEVTAESLARTRESIPESAKGKIALITVAFLRESQPQLDSWLEPFIEKYGSKEGFTFYEVPMISSGYTFMRLIIDSGMRGGIPKEKHTHVVTMYGNVEKYMSALGLDARFGHAFLLDREGIIRWQGQGFSTPETLKELFDMAEKIA